jgi:uncharacterized phiE125 gp8 family phage protein
MLSLVTGATDEPLTLAQVVAQSRLDGLDDGDEQAFIESVLIPASRDRAELATRRAIPKTQTWEYTLDDFPAERFIEIPRPPLIRVVSVSYVDRAGATQVWGSANYLVQAPAGPRCRRGRIALPYGGVWPVPQAQMGAVTIQFECGYTTVPPLLMAAMLMDVGRLYENRESIIADAGIRVAIELPGGSRDIYRSFLSVATQRLGAGF